jgi:hypothetical protein
LIFNYGGWIERTEREKKRKERTLDEKDDAPIGIAVES